MDLWLTFIYGYIRWSLIGWCFNKVLLFEKRRLCDLLWTKYFVEGIFRKRPSKECAFTLSALVDRGFYPGFWSFTVFSKLSELIWTGPLLACPAKKVCFPLFHWLRNLSFIAKELARAANEHKNETINDSPWLWNKGLCHYSCNCKFKIFWQDSLAFATLFIT